MDKELKCLCGYENTSDKWSEVKPEGYSGFNGHISKGVVGKWHTIGQNATARTATK